MNTSNPKFGIGFTATYINDFPEFSHVAHLPAEAAVAWVKDACSDTVMGLRAKAADLTIGVDNDTDVDKNGWLNKLFVIVSFEHNRWLALFNHDGKFSLYASSNA